MNIVRTFGSLIARETPRNPARARALLLAGWRAQLLNLKLNPDRRLPPSRQYAAKVAMDVITRALRHPKQAAAISAFCPYEPLQAAGILPYSVEQLSCFIAGSTCERAFLDSACDAGFSDTMCSYHRTFLGAAESGIMPAPAFVVYTSVACDGNFITFPHIARLFDIPSYCIDVPFDRSEDAIADVAEQLRGMTAFIGECTKTPVDESALSQAVARGVRSARDYRRFLDASPGRRLSADMTTEMYAFLTNHVLMGSPETETFCRMIADEMEQAPASDGLRIVWLHTMPFSQQPAIDALNFSDRAFITACDLSADPMLIDVDPEKPYDAMARRLVLSCFNGATSARIERALDLVRRTAADGVALYGHWGCKATLGAERLIQQALDEQGVPCLVLDGDGIDASNRSDGQTATRLEAFLELLKGRRS